MKIKLTALGGILSGTLDRSFEKTHPEIVFPLLHRGPNRSYASHSALRFVWKEFDGEFDVYELAGISVTILDRVRYCADYITEVYRNGIDPYYVMSTGQLYRDIPGLTQDEFMAGRALYSNERNL